jgi:hypothetical protein
MDGSINDDWTSRSGIAETHMESFVTSYSSCPGSVAADIQRATDTCSMAPAGVCFVFGAVAFAFGLNPFVTSLQRNYCKPILFCTSEVLS